MLVCLLVLNLLQGPNILPLSPTKFLVWTGAALPSAKKEAGVMARPHIPVYLERFLAGHFHYFCLWIQKSKRPFLHIYAIFHDLMDATTASVL